MLYEPTNACLREIRSKKSFKIDDTEKGLRGLVNDDPKIIHAYVHYMLTTTLKEISFSLYDFYLDKEGKIESLVDAAKKAVADFAPTFAEAEFQYPSLTKAVESPINTQTFFEAHRWVSDTSIKEVLINDVLAVDPDSPFSGYEYFFSFPNRKDAIEFAKNNPANFIAFVSHPNHLYFVAKYVDKVYFIRANSDVDKYGLQTQGRRTEPCNPFTLCGDPCIASGLFRQNKNADTTNLPVLKNYSKDVFEALPYEALSNDKKLFIAFAQERLVEEIKETYRRGDADIVSNMQSVNLLPFCGQIEGVKSEPLCQSPYARFLYDTYEHQVTNLAPVAHDFFATEKEFALMVQFEKENAIRDIIYSEIDRTLGDGRKDKSYISAAPTYQENISILMPIIAQKAETDILSMVFASDRVNVVRKRGKDFFPEIIAKIDNKFDHNNGTAVSIGLFDRIVVKKGFGKYNDYDRERKSIWRTIGSQDADAVVAINVYSVFSLINIIGREAFDSLPFAYRLMFCEYSEPGNRNGITKSHFNLNSPLDTLVQRVASRDSGIRFLIPVSAQVADEVVSAIDKQINEEHKQIGSDVPFSGLPGYLYTNDEVVRLKWDTTSTGKITGCALYRKEKKSGQSAPSHRRSYH